MFHGMTASHKNIGDQPYVNDVLMPSSASGNSMGQTRNQEIEIAARNVIATLGEFTSGSEGRLGDRNGTPPQVQDLSGSISPLTLALGILFGGLLLFSIYRLISYRKEFFKCECAGNELAASAPRSSESSASFSGNKLQHATRWANSSEYSMIDLV